MRHEGWLSGHLPLKRQRGMGKVVCKGLTFSKQISGWFEELMESSVDSLESENNYGLRDDGEGQTLLLSWRSAAPWGDCRLLGTSTTLCWTSSKMCKKIMLTGIFEFCIFH